MDTSEIAGAIFDIDDTLLDNKRHSQKGSLHARSQLVAVRTVGEINSIPALEGMSREESEEAFLTAREHTLESGLFNMFYRAGLLSQPDIDAISIIASIVELKDHIHEAILISKGEAFEGAVEFVRGLAYARELEEKLSIASMSTRRDADIFLGKVGLSVLFSEERIITKEKVEHPKPHPEVFDKAFLSLGLPESDRSRTYAFEDDPRGIKAAREAGLRVCAITTRFDRDYLASQDTPPHIIADSFAEFSRMFHV